MPEPTPLTFTLTLTRRHVAIHLGLHPSLGDNLNGPSLIRVPPWLPNPLGHYYLCFAHHSGQHLRLGYADSLAGPWHIHAPGVLPYTDTPSHDHVGAAHGPVNQLRDPAFFHDTDGQSYLLYSIAAEQGIALAPLTRNSELGTGDWGLWNPTGRALHGATFADLLLAFNCHYMTVSSKFKHSPNSPSSIPRGRFSTGRKPLSGRRPMGLRSMHFSKGRWGRGKSSATGGACMGSRPATPAPVRTPFHWRKPSMDPAT